jgi:hypothetical protein
MNTIPNLLPNIKFNISDWDYAAKVLKVRSIEKRSLPKCLPILAFIKALAVKYDKGLIINLS